MSSVIVPPAPAPLVKATRALFIRNGLQMMGLEYIFGGRSARNGVDCMGVPIVALEQATGGAVNLQHWWTVKAWEELPETTTPLPGDLAFYGEANGHPVSHVMVVLLPEWSAGCPGGLVFGACGGDSSVTTYSEAARRDARVRVRQSIRYRKPDDFRGYRSLSPYLE